MPNVSVSPGMVLVGVRELLPAQANNPASGVLPTGVFPVQPFIAELLKATLPVTSGFNIATIIYDATLVDAGSGGGGGEPFPYSGSVIISAGHYPALVLNLSVGSQAPSGTYAGSIILSLYNLQPQSGIITGTVASTGWMTQTTEFGTRISPSRETPLGLSLMVTWNGIGTAYNVYLDAEQTL